MFRLLLFILLTRSLLLSYSAFITKYTICFISSIAFKPAESGWGGGSNKYNNNFDKIFGGGTKKTEKKDDERPAAEGGSIRISNEMGRFDLG